ncbi:conserved hypothetical protein [Trichinella spiralis]|uniref:hypothetical protein n=1 Tax=Trichinella spiralis TaxID=6334 RepID=UPI0001EFE777|nr:conserved hypothetical protein [Trichinella spiralis]
MDELTEMYFRLVRIAPERRAALLQYYTDDDVRGVILRIGSERFSLEFFRCEQQRAESVRVHVRHLRWPFSKAIPGLCAAADKTLLQQFKAGLSANAVKLLSWEERVWRKLTMLKGSVSSFKAEGVQEGKHPAVEVTEATAPAVTTGK